jgi:hypothetical protein
MLLSSILQILNQYDPQPHAVARMSAPPGGETFSIQVQAASGLQELEAQIAAAAGLLRPISVEPGQAPVALPGPNLEELMQIIAKLKEPKESRVLDVFE